VPVLRGADHEPGDEELADDGCACVDTAVRLHLQVVAVTLKADWIAWHDMGHILMLSGFCDGEVCKVIGQRGSREDICVRRPDGGYQVEKLASQNREWMWL
jgi:hypothetical protein